MYKKVLSDLEKMNKSREEQAKAYMEKKEQMLEVYRITREGISNVEELVTYLVACIEDAEHMEDISRKENNNIMYSETIAIRREFTKLLKLMLMDGTADQKIEDIDGTEEAHRANSEGEEAYQ